MTKGKTASPPTPSPDPELLVPFDANELYHGLLNAAYFQPNIREIQVWIDRGANPNWDYGDRYPQTLLDLCGRNRGVRSVLEKNGAKPAWKDDDNPRGNVVRNVQTIPELTIDLKNVDNLIAETTAQYVALARQYMEAVDIRAAGQDFLCYDVNPVGIFAPWATAETFRYVRGYAPVSMKIRDGVYKEWFAASAVSPSFAVLNRELHKVYANIDALQKGNGEPYELSAAGKRWLVTQAAGSEIVRNYSSSAENMVKNPAAQIPLHAYARHLRNKGDTFIDEIAANDPAFKGILETIRCVLNESDGAKKGMSPKEGTLKTNLDLYRTKLAALVEFEDSYIHANKSSSAPESMVIHYGRAAYTPQGSTEEVKIQGADFPYSVDGKKASPVEDAALLTSAREKVRKRIEMAARRLLDPGDPHDRIIAQHLGSMKASAADDLTQYFSCDNKARPGIRRSRIEKLIGKPGFFAEQELHPPAERIEQADIRTGNVSALSLMGMGHLRVGAPVHG